MDAIVIEICRPTDYQTQQQYDCGKHKFHCVKFQYMVNLEGKVIHSSHVVEGKMHDKKLFDQS